MMHALRAHFARRRAAAARNAIIAQAQDSLQRMVDERRNSFAIQDYRKRREAALKGLER